MTCKPTVGEVRDVLGIRRRVVEAGARDPLGWWHEQGTYVSGSVATTIVVVAPKNRARVTAGPAWMGAR